MSRQLSRSFKRGYSPLKIPSATLLKEAWDNGTSYILMKKTILRSVKVNNEEETRAFGHEIAANAYSGEVIALIGPMGTGKTALTRYIAEGLGVKERISSPTFNIIKEYRSGRLPLFHFDVYRLAGQEAELLTNGESSPEAIEELYNIGADEYFFGDGISIVEWADLVSEALPEETEYIFIEYGENEGERTYKCTF